MEKLESLLRQLARSGVEDSRVELRLIEGDWSWWVHTDDAVHLKVKLDDQSLDEAFDWIAKDVLVARNI